MKSQQRRRNGNNRLLELKRNYERAQRAIQARDDMLAMVSHDLKAPLHSLTLQIDALLMRAPDCERRVIGRKQLQAARRAAEVMSRLVVDLLDASKLDAGRLRIQLRKHDLTRLVAECTDAFTLAAHRKSIALNIVSPRQSLPAVCDRDRISQVLSNLLDNAIRFTPNGGAICVRTQLIGAEKAEISIMNSGVGIPPEYIAHVFDRYWQAGEGGLGSGLGLYIAKRIVEAHRGTIRVASNLGKDTIFVVTLPAAVAISTNRGGALRHT